MLPRLNYIIIIINLSYSKRPKYIIKFDQFYNVLLDEKYFQVPVINNLLVTINSESKTHNLGI